MPIIFLGVFDDAAPQNKVVSSHVGGDSVADHLSVEIVDVVVGQFVFDGIRHVAHAFEELFEAVYETGACEDACFLEGILFGSIVGVSLTAFTPLGGGPLEVLNVGCLAELVDEVFDHLLVLQVALPVERLGFHEDLVGFVLRPDDQDVGRQVLVVLEDDHVADQHFGPLDRNHCFVPDHVANVVVLHVVRTRPLLVFLEVFDHREYDDDCQWKQRGGDPVCDRYHGDHLQDADEHELNVGNLLELFLKIYIDKRIVRLLCRTNFIVKFCV